MPATVPVKATRARVFVSRDAKALLWVLTIFNWTSLLLYSRTAPLDYVAFFTAGRLVLIRHGHQLFDFASQAHFQAANFGFTGILPFNHVAYEALVFTPLSYFSFPVSLWMWRSIVAVTIGGICILVLRIFRIGYAESLPLVLSFLSTAVTFAQGQDSLLQLWLIVGAFWALVEGKDGMAGGLLAMGFFKPQLVLPIAIVVAWKRGKRFSISLLGGIVVILAVSTALIGTGGWKDWILLLRNAGFTRNTDIGAPFLAMANLRGFAEVVFPHGKTAEIVALVAAAVVFLITVWRLKDVRDVKAYFPATVAMTVLVSYHLNIHDVVLCLIPIIALIASNNRRRSAQVCLGFAFAFPAFLMMRLIPYYFFVVVGLWLLTLTGLNVPEGDDFSMAEAQTGNS